MNVAFVGLCPSKYNTNPNIPFEGTPSHSTLLDWLSALNISSITLLNLSNRVSRSGEAIRPQDIDYKGLQARLEAFKENRGKVVALGGVVSHHLTKMGIEHFKLPHPSPRNRLLNSKAFVEQCLLNCRQWLLS